MRLFVASRWCDSCDSPRCGNFLPLGASRNSNGPNESRSSASCRLPTSARSGNQNCAATSRRNSPPNAPRWLLEPLRHKEIDHGRRKRNPPAQKPDRKTRAQQSDASIASDDREDRARRADAAAASALGDPAFHRQQGAQREHPRTHLCQVRRLSGAQGDRRESDRRRARPRLRAPIDRIRNSISNSARLSESLAPNCSARA